VRATHLGGPGDDDGARGGLWPTTVYLLAATMTE